MTGFVLIERMDEFKKAMEQCNFEMAADIAADFEEHEMPETATRLYARIASAQEPNEMDERHRDLRHDQGGR